MANMNMNEPAKKSNTKLTRYSIMWIWTRMGSLTIPNSFAHALRSR